MFNFMRLPPLRRLMLMKAITGGGSWSTISGNPVSFTAKAAPLRQLKVAFSPVQSLNGYDSPWPAGGGKNKLPDSDSTATVYDVTMVESNGKFTFTGTANSSGGRYALKTPSFSLKAGTYYAKVFNETGSVIPTLIVQKGTEYFSGAGAFTLTEDADNINIGFNVASGSVYNYSAYVGVFTENVTTYSPYSNECPISGWSSLTVEQTGVNIWSPDDSTDGYYSANGTFNPPTVNAEVTSDYIPVPSGVAGFTLGYNNLEAGETGWVGIAYFDKDKQWISRWGTTTAQGIVYVGTSAPEAKYIRTISRTYGHGRAGLMLAFGRIESYAFTPYNPSSRSISISLGSTVYSGYVDVISGVGDGDMDSVDMGTLDWTLYTVGSGDHLFRTSNIPNFVGANRGMDFLCDRYKTVDANQRTNGTISQTLLRVVDVIDNSYETAADFTTAMSGAQLVYKVNEPMPITITPQEVQSLEGDNTMWTDADSLTVEYRSN